MEKVFTGFPNPSASKDLVIKVRYGHFAYSVDSLNPVNRTCNVANWAYVLLSVSPMAPKDSVLIQSSNARWLFLGQLLSQLFDRVTSLGLIWLLTNQFSSFATSWFLVIGGLPHLLFSLHSVRALNRFGFRKVLVLSDLFRAGVYALVAAVIFLNGELTSIVPFLMMTFLANAAASVFNPAILSVPIHVVEEKQVQGLTSLLSGCGSLSVVLGPVLAVFLSGLMGLAGILALTAVAYLLAAIASSLVKTRTSSEKSPEAAQSASAVSENPLIVVRRYQLITVMLASFLMMNFLIGPLQIIFPVYAKEIYQMSMGGLAWLETSLGVGMIIGAFALSVTRPPASPTRAIALGLIVCSLCLLVFVVTKDFLIGRIALAAFGFFLSFANVLIISLFQQHPKRGDVPGIMAMVNLIGVASIPLSLATASGLAMLMSIRTLAISAALLLVLVTVITAFLLRHPRFKTAEALP